MNCEERILATFRFETTDHPPLFEQSVDGEVVRAILGRPAFGFATDLHYHEARARIQGPAAARDFMGQLLDDLAAFADALGMDMIAPPWLLWQTPAEQLDEFSFLYRDDEGECVRAFDPASRTFGIVRQTPRAEGLDRVRLFVEKRAACASDALPLPEEYLDFMQRLLEKCRGRRAVAGASFFALPVDADWLMALLLDPDLVEEWLDIMLAMELRSADLHASLGIRVINGGGDMADKSGPVYSPGIFASMILPRLKQIIARHHEHGAYYIYRTDGNVWPVAKMLLEESGTDAFGEIDIAAGMDFARLRDQFPKLVLWGGLSCGDLLIRGTTGEIVQEALRLRRLFERDGGWILASSNTLLPGTNVKGYLAALEAVRQK